MDSLPFPDLKHSPAPGLIPSLTSRNLKVQVGRPCLSIGKRCNRLLWLGVCEVVFTQ
jgi:hypothetical protein